MQNAKITGIASYVPDYVLTNDELSHMVDTNDEWITTRVGIKERRILKGGETGSSDLGVKAVAELLKKTGVKPSEARFPRNHLQTPIHLSYHTPPRAPAADSLKTIALFS